MENLQNIKVPFIAKTNCFKCDATFTRTYTKLITKTTEIICPTCRLKAQRP